ncbi:hypothetical protein NDU88_000746 [Pleurodeles waltl]|uniref:Uncharacterized protein n=1 Tax=Pleurodeles waltl TaxID=8319 RepID=A0AAV7UT82_PLEWA|nr:hypothetical protein NDU88_000746 [Pleurodeles waltl]
MYEGKDHSVGSIAFSVTQGCSVERGVVLEPSRGPMLLLALFALHASYRSGGREGSGGVPACCRLREPQLSRCQGAGRDEGRALSHFRLQRGTRLSVSGWFHTRGRGSEACRRPQACSPRSVRRLRGGRSPRVTDVGRSLSPTPTSAPAAFGGPMEHLQRRRHRRVARHCAELGSQAAIMDRGQTTPQEEESQDFVS